MTSRRTFIKQSSLGLAALTFPFSKTKSVAPLCYFTKEMQWASYDEVGMMLNELGFDGADLSLRKRGSIEPENAAKELPKFVSALNRHGISVPMMASDIGGVGYPNIEEFLKIISDNGIKYYRMAYLKYDFKKSIEANIEIFHAGFQKLAALNAKYGLAASYQNHAGTSLGASVWDVVYSLKGIDKKQVGAQFDIRHAVVEGGESWPVDFAAIKSHINTIVTKDFYWAKNEAGKWKVKNVPLGEGMVDFDAYFKLYKEAGLDVPMTNHTEYPIFNEEQEHLSNKEKMKIILPVIRKDLNVIKKYL
ncbi:Sugar phosphate isomerase/epimerase [Spirosomataceae bacterium TFI 002]|nr:Sugar phosphate isomerase/epimerase [Spirosomataceae bacterium TFI 002]